MPASTDPSVYLSLSTYAAYEGKADKKQCIPLHPFYRIDEKFLLFPSDSLNVTEYEKVAYLPIFFTLFPEAPNAVFNAGAGFQSMLEMGLATLGACWEQGMKLGLPYDEHFLAQTLPKNLLDSDKTDQYKGKLQRLYFNMVKASYMYRKNQSVVAAANDCDLRKGDSRPVSPDNSSYPREGGCSGSRKRSYESNRQSNFVHLFAKWQVHRKASIVSH